MIQGAGRTTHVPPGLPAGSPRERCLHDLAVQLDVDEGAALDLKRPGLVEGGFRRARMLPSLHHWHQLQKSQERHVVKRADVEESIGVICPRVDLETAAIAWSVGHRHDDIALLCSLALRPSSERVSQGLR